MDGDGDSRQKIAENRPVRLKPQFFQSKARRTAEQNDQHHSDDSNHGAVAKI